MLSRSSLSSILAVLAVTLFSHSAAFASAGAGSGGGGNFSGLSAASALKLVPENLKLLGSDLVTPDQLRAITELATSKTTVVAVSRAPIPVNIAGVVQESSAFTVGGESSAVILVYQGDWDAHSSNLNEEIAFMTHEACVALGIEQTGKYGTVSAEILNRLNTHHKPVQANTIPITTALSCTLFQNGSPLKTETVQFQPSPDQNPNRLYGEISATVGNTNRKIVGRIYKLLGASTYILNLDNGVIQTRAENVTRFAGKYDEFGSSSGVLKLDLYSNEPGIEMVSLSCYDL